MRGYDRILASTALALILAAPFGSTAKDILAAAPMAVPAEPVSTPKKMSLHPAAAINSISSLSTQSVRALHAHV